MSSELLAAMLQPTPVNVFQRGIVKSYSVPNATAVVEVNGREVTLPVMRPWTPSPGNVALVLQTADGRSYAVGQIGHLENPPPPIPPPAPLTLGTFTFPAQAAGTYKDGVWQWARQDVAQGDQGSGTLQGIWTIGASPAATMTGLTPTGGRVWIHRMPGGDNAPQEIRAYLHNSATRPDTAPPGFGFATLGLVAVDEAKWLDLPIGWVQSICAATARGIGLYSATADPYVSCAPLSVDAQTGTIQISWGI